MGLAEELKINIEEIEKRRKLIAMYRDELRDIVDDTVLLIETCKEADGLFKDGIDLLADGLDEISQYI